MPKINRYHSVENVVIYCDLNGLKFFNIVKFCCSMSQLRKIIHDTSVQQMYMYYMYFFTEWGSGEEIYHGLEVLRYFLSVLYSMLFDPDFDG